MRVSGFFFNENKRMEKKKQEDIFGVFTNKFKLITAQLDF